MQIPLMQTNLEDILQATREMNLNDLLTVILILAPIGGFFKYVWPRMAQIWALRGNQKLLDQVDASLEREYEPEKLYDDLDKCKEVVKRSEERYLWRQQEKALQQQEQINHRLRYRVRLFLLAQSLDKDHCASFLLEQNLKQSLFQFELGLVRNFDPKPVEDGFRSVSPGVGLLAFIEECEQILAKNEWPLKSKWPQKSLLRDEPIRIVVTQVPLPRNYYLWGHFEGKDTGCTCYEPNKFWVISIATLDGVLPDIPAEQFLLRVIQRACVNSLLPTRPHEVVSSRLSHPSTNGCLFDFTPLLRDARHFVTCGWICEDCASSILSADEIPPGHRSKFLNELRDWIDATSLKT